MGGFKIGVEFSFRKCRMCLATSDQLSTKVGLIWWLNRIILECICVHTVLLAYYFDFLQFKARDFNTRTPETYDYHCALLDGPLSYFMKILLLMV